MCKYLRESVCVCRIGVGKNQRTQSSSSTKTEKNQEIANICIMFRDIEV